MNRQPTLLLVEDCDISAGLVEQALQETGFAYPVRRARTGREALDILRGDNGHVRLSLPHVVVVDIGLPGLDGLEFAKIVRNEQALRNTMIFMMTGSKDSEIIQAAYELNISGYILKDRMIDDVAAVTKYFKHYLQLVELPNTR